MTTTPDPERFAILDGGPDIDAREARLIDGADELEAARRRPSVFGHERFLITVAAALMTLGVAIIAIGWNGAANATVVEEQVPYLISGGVLGLALATIGALTLFSHWLTVAIREARTREAARRRDHEELMDALRSLGTAFGGRDGDGSTAGRARTRRRA